MKDRALQLVFQSIVRFWVHPLESRIIPRLESARQTRINSTFLKWFSWWANAGRVAVLELRVDVVRWVGSEWSVTYIGDGASTEYLNTILFSETPKTEEFPQVYIWQVPGLIQRFSGEGDLVVCELNEILKWSFDGLNTFFIGLPSIIQVLEGIDRPLEEIMSSMNQTMRRRVRQLETERFSYIFTQEKEDFDFFYYRMYLPYTNLRHHGQGMILNDYETTLNYFKQGGLILIKDGLDPVCGMLCLLEGDMCHALQMGVLDGEFDLVKRGVNVALWWFMLLWARDQGAQKFDFGISWAQTSNGVFNFKRQWGTRVYLNQLVSTRLSFYAQVLPDKLRAHLNTLGNITIVDGKFYQLILLNPKETSTTTDYTRELKHAESCGLAGLVLISDNSKLQVISKTTD